MGLSSLSTKGIRPTPNASLMQFLLSWEEKRGRVVSLVRMRVCAGSKSTEYVYKGMSSMCPRMRWMGIFATLRGDAAAPRPLVHRASVTQPGKACR